VIDMSADLVDEIEETSPPSPFSVVCWVIGCLVWAFLAQVAIRPDLFPATSGLADDSNGSWSIWVVRAAIPLIIGIALARRYHTWPAVATLSTIAAAVIGVNAGIAAIPAPAEFAAVHRPGHGHWDLLNPDGPPTSPSALWILVGIAVGAFIATVVWFAVSGLLWLGMLVRRGVQQLMTRVG
jgi:hypothetical protein